MNCLSALWDNVRTSLIKALPTSRPRFLETLMVTVVPLRRISSKGTPVHRSADFPNTQTTTGHVWQSFSGEARLDAV
jgi:hypothetical protein